MRPTSFRLLVSIGLLGLGLSLPVLAPAGPSQRVAQRTRQAQRAHAFERAAKRSRDPLVGRALDLVVQLRSGDMVPSYARDSLRHRIEEARAHEIDKLPTALSTAGFDAALALALEQGARSRAKRALEQLITNEGRPPREREGALDRLSARILATVDGYHLNRALGRRALATKAARVARRLGARFGLSAEVETALRVVPRFEKDAGHSNGSARELRPIGIVRPWGHSQQRSGADLSKRPKDARRMAGGHPLWWGGYQVAYLDLLYRRLPELIVGHLKRDPQKPFHIWQAGHEDASQTILLAAMVDEAVARVAKENPRLRAVADNLSVRIIATDLVQGFKRRGREIRFNVADGPEAAKFPIVAADIGVGERQKAKRSVARGERLLAARPQDRDRALRRLTEVGKFPLLFESLLSASYTNHSYESPHESIVPGYRLKPGKWQIIDQENGGVLDSQVGNRVIRFQFGDLTKTRPRVKADLVVCTNVLPYLELYSFVAKVPHAQRKERLETANAAFENLTAALKPGGALLVDARSISMAKQVKQQADYQAEKDGQARLPSLLERLQRGKKSLWVTATTAVEDVRDLDVDYSEWR